MFTEIKIYTYIFITMLKLNLTLLKNIHIFFLQNNYDIYHQRNFINHAFISDNILTLKRQLMRNYTKLFIVNLQYIFRQHNILELIFNATCFDSG